MVMENSSDKCSVCLGKGTIITGNDCPFCNCTGEYNHAAEAYKQNHICQCVFLDRKNCPICGTKCHHNTPNRPKLLIGGGYKF